MNRSNNDWAVAGRTVPLGARTLVMGVVNLTSGRPTMLLTGGAARHLETLVPGGFKPDIHLTITDDYPWAQAIVIISCLPAA